MISHDLRRWPLVSSTMRGLPSTDDYLRFLDDWSSWLDMGMPFVMLRHYVDAPALCRPEGGAREAKAWLADHRDRIRMLVVGMATVVPADQLAQIRRMNAEALFQVPARSFDRSEDARVWLRSCLQARDMDAQAG